MHHHHHHHLHPAETMGRAYIIAILLNLAFVAVEFFAGFYYDSMGLLADAGHNLSDVGSLGIALLAFCLAKKKVTENFTYGWKKATIHASLINSILLCVAVGAIIIESVDKLFHPGEINGIPIIITAAVGIVINGVTVLLFLKDREKDLNVKGVYLHMLGDTLVSVGVVVSGLIIWLTGWTIIDPIIGLIIAAVIISAGWNLMLDSIRLALDGMPVGIHPDEIQKHILENGNVSGIHHLHIWAISTTENALTAHIVLKSLEAMEQTKEEIHHELEHHGIAHSTLEFETPGFQCHNPADI